MSEQKAPPRPRQVTMAGVMSVVGSLLLVLSLFDTLGRLRTPETREAVGEFLSTPPGSGLGIDVAQAVELMRALALASGALAAMALVFAVFVLQRHVPARIGFTIVAGLLLLTVPVAGLMPLLLAFSALLMWSQPARDWYAGRAPGGERAAPLRSEEQRPGGWPPPPSPEPSGPSAGPQAGALPHHPPPPEPHAWQQPPAHQAPPPYGGLPVYYGRPPTGQEAERRPRSVTIAAVLTWVGTGATAAAMVLLAAVLAAGGDAFVEQFDQAARSSEVNLSSDEVLAVGWGITGFFLIWSLVAAVLAGFAFRRSNPARIALVVSAVMSALLSLLMVLSGISLVTLALSVATVVLLFTGGANDWYARRGQGHPGYPSYPPYQEHRDYPPPPPQQQPPDPQQPQGRDKPW